MKEKYLVINAGSSSLKFSLYELPGMTETVNGIVEKIGYEDSSYTLKYNGKKIELNKNIMNHTEAVSTMLQELLTRGFIKTLDEIKGVGHRVLHGCNIYTDSVVITDTVLDNIKMLTKLGPLHHPGEIAAIESMNECLKGVPQVAVFDTSFHRTIPEVNYLYAVPYDWYTENEVRKYGFHGTSHKYITEVMQDYYKKDNVNLIVCHLGSGASISCVKDGKCFDTTMGLTPLDGLVMGTRCGAIDPSILEYICKERNLTIEQVTDILYNKSGVFGIAGKNDFRDLRKSEDNNDKMATLAIDMFKKSVIRYIAEYYFELEGNVDSLVFTAGIGENEILLRESIINSISSTMDITLDKNVNDNIAKFKSNQKGIITKSNSKFDVWVMPTNEEYMILKDTCKLTKKM